MTSLHNTFKCTEDFSKMTPTERGGFCDKCEKEVIDLRHLSDAEILDLTAEKSEFCGRIQESRLNKPLRGIAAAAIGVLASLNSFGQAVLPSENNTISDDHQQDWSAEMKPTEISGTIIDSLNQEPIFQAVINVFDQNGEQIARGMTDFDGIFRIKFDSNLDQFKLNINGGMGYHRMDTVVRLKDPVNDRRAVVEIPLGGEIIEVITVGIMITLPPEDSAFLSVNVRDAVDSVDIDQYQINNVQFKRYFKKTIPLNEPFTFSASAPGYKTTEIQLSAEEVNSDFVSSDVYLERETTPPTLPESVEYAHLVFKAFNEKGENISIDSIHVAAPNDENIFYSGRTDSYWIYIRDLETSELKVAVYSKGYETLEEKISLNPYHPEFNVFYIYLKEE